MGQTLTLSRSPAVPPPPALDLRNEAHGRPDPFERVFESEPAPRLIRQAPRRSQPVAKGAVSCLAGVLSRTAGRLPTETPRNEAKRASRKRSHWSFGNSPVAALADELDPMPFVADERRIRDEVHWPEVEILNLPLDRLDQEPVPSRRGLVRARLMEVNLEAVALKCEAPIPPGTMLKLRLDAGEGSHLEMAAEVLRGEERESGPVAICRLRRHLTFAEIQKIGRGIFESILV